MSKKVTFEEDTSFSLQRKKRPEKLSNIENFLVTAGLAQSKKGARKILVVVSLVLLGASIVYTIRHEESGSQYGNYDQFIQSYSQ